MSERNTERQITVRQVTDVQASWTQQGRGEPGAFTIQLILDNGAEEYVLQPDAQDTKVQLEMLKTSKSVYFDLERKVLIPSNIALGGK
jgi:hypothetical protein